MRTKIILLIILFFIVFILLFIFKVKDGMVDFEVNYKAAQRMRVAETLYRVEDEHYMFKYLPFSTFLYLPLSLLPLDIAKGLWYFIIILCLFFLVYISNKCLPARQRRSLYLFAVPPLILFKFFLREIQLGQINALVTLISLLLIWFLVDEKIAQPPQREIIAGLLWGLATAIKPYVLIFLPYFLIKKKWRILFSGFGLFIAALLAPSLYYGFRGNVIVLKEWIITFSQSTPNLLTSQDNVSIIAFFAKWTANQNISFLLSGTIIIVLSLLVLVLVLKGKSIAQAPILECSVLLTLIPLVSPLGWDYTLLMSILGLLIIIQNFQKYSKPWKVLLVVNLLIISLTSYETMGRELYASFMSWSVITINFLILIGYLAYLRLRKIC